MRPFLLFSGFFSTASVSIAIHRLSFIHPFHHIQSIQSIARAVVSYLLAPLSPLFFPRLPPLILLSRYFRLLSLSL